MKPIFVGIMFAILGMLQAAGAYTRSRLFQALPHFQRSTNLFGEETTVVLHVFFGLVGCVIGILIMAGVIPIKGSDCCQTGEKTGQIGNGKIAITKRRTAKSGHPPN